MRIEPMNMNTVSLTVMSPADALVGEYSIYVETKKNDSEENFFRKELEETIYVLFNAWCEGKTVSLPWLEQ